MITQSDHGTENYGIAYAHTFMRQHLDPDLKGTLQHNFMRGHTNIKPERAWGRLRDTWSKGFEDMLNIGIMNQWYNTSNLVDRYGSFHAYIFGFLLIHVVLPFAGLRSHTFKQSLTSMLSCTTQLADVPTSTRFYHRGSLSICSGSLSLLVHLISRQVLCIHN